MPRCLLIMSAQRLLLIIDACDIFLHDTIDCMSVADIRIIPGCIFIIDPQRLLFPIAVRDIFLHDIIVFMSALLGIVIPGAEDMGLAPIEPCCICASAGDPPTTASTSEAHRIFTWVIVHLLEALGTCHPGFHPDSDRAERSREGYVDVLTVRFDDAAGGGPSLALFDFREERSGRRGPRAPFLTSQGEGYSSCPEAPSPGIFGGAI